MTATIVPGRVRIDEALSWIAETAAERDREPVPPFPEEGIARLEAADGLAFNARPGRVARRPPMNWRSFVPSPGPTAPSVGSSTVISTASSGWRSRRLPEVRDRELAAVRDNHLRIGVWGADPRPHEGEPATIMRRHEAEFLTGVKTFCSGAGGVDRALVLARDPDADAPVAVWVDVTDADAVEVDVRWYQGSDCAPRSHTGSCFTTSQWWLVGPPGALAQQPWFSRDALRTAAKRVGNGRCGTDSALMELAN